MSKVLSLSVAALAAMSIPAISADTASSQAAFTAQLSANANAQQVRQLLIAKNYSNVSQLDRDEDGRWIGTAVKDGKKRFVSVYLPAKSPASATN